MPEDDPEEDVLTAGMPAQAARARADEDSAMAESSRIAETPFIAAETCCDLDLFDRDAGRRTFVG